MKKLHYVSPEVGVVEIAAEKGIAQSTEVQAIESLNQGVEAEW